MSNNNNISYIDGIRFHRALSSGIQNVISRKDYLNKINVFPVPDSDTGTNMAFTLNAVLNGAAKNICQSISEMLFQIADSALDGARGNSGAILAQFFQGMSDGCKNSEKMTPNEFAKAIKMGSIYAREALGEPREGTILTILTDFSNHLINEINLGKTDFVELFNSAVIIAEESLKNTPNQLKVLKKAGVVDAGAQGFVDLLHGIQEFIQDGDLKNLEIFNTSNEDDNLIENNINSEPADLTFRYCTECLIVGENIDRKNLRSQLQDFGNSLVIAGSKEKTKIHIHTNEPGKLFKFSEKFGTVINQKADDMLKQNEDAHGEHGDIAIISDSGSDIPDELMDKYNIHIVPVRYNFGDKDYIDKVSLTSKEFYNELVTNPNHPQTSQPTPGDFKKQYEFLSSHYKSLISIHLPSALSGTMQSAQTASNKIKKSNISIIDSLSISGGMGLIVTYAAEAAHMGYSKNEINDLISKIIPKTNVYASVFDLSYSVKGGRIPKIVKTISDIIKFNPILSANDIGKMKISGGFFGKKHFAKKTANVLLKKLSSNKSYRIIISHCNCNNRANNLLTILKNAIKNIDFSYVIDCGSALGVHIGPGSLVIGIQEYIPIKPKK